MNTTAWGHSVADLLKELSETQTVPEEMMAAALEIDKAYIATRHPDAHPSCSPRRRYTRAEAQRLISYANSIMQFCEGILSSL